MLHLNEAQLVLRDHKCAKNAPMPSQHHQPEPLIQGEMDPQHHLISNSTLILPFQRVVAETETHQTFLNSGKPVRNIAFIPPKTHGAAHVLLHTSVVTSNRWSCSCCSIIANQSGYSIRSVDIFSSWDPRDGSAWKCQYISNWPT